MDYLQSQGTTERLEGMRTKLGLIVPSSNTTMEPEFYQHIPSSVSLHSARMKLGSVTADDLRMMEENSERCAELLSSANVDAIAYGCTTGSLVDGPGHAEDIENHLGELTKIPVVATAASVKRALNALNIEKISIATPYVSDITQKEQSYFRNSGFEVVQIRGLGHESNIAIGNLSPDIAYREAEKANQQSAEAVFISCTNFATFEIIKPLEDNLQKPVITSNQATLWDILRTTDISLNMESALGELFEVCE